MSLRLKKKYCLYIVAPLFFVFMSIRVVNFSFGVIIKNEFYSDSPQYKKALTELEECDLLRDYVYRKVLWADSENDIISYSTRFYNNVRKIGLENFVIYKELHLKDKGFWCGDTSLTLAEVYDLFGKKSCIADFAIYNTNNGVGGYVNSHVITLVKINSSWIVEDASFNVSYVDLNNNRLSIFEIQRRVKNGCFDDIFMIDFQLSEKNLVSNGIVSCADLLVKEHYDDMFENCFDVLNGYDLPSKGICLFLFPYSVSGLNQNWLRKEELPDLELY